MGTPSTGALRAVLVVAAAAVVVGVAGCSHGEGPAPTPAGCGLVPRTQVVALTGDHTTSSGRGSVARLRGEHATATCRAVDAQDRRRFVSVRAVYHPKPFDLPDDECSEGWVYAGTPDKYTPACQEFADGRGRTELIVRWQPYVMTVIVGRPDRDWAGDPETALAMSRVLAQRLGVREAAGDG